MSASVDKAKMRVLLMRMAVGAVIGAVSMGLFLTFVGDPIMKREDPGAVVAMVAGLSYLLIGLMVWVGLAAPGIGARFLNVEDADELREEAPKLKSGIAVLVLTGLFLLVLALADAALLSRELTLLVALACVAGAATAAWLGAKRYDEMTKRLGQEVGTLTLQAGMLVLAVWAALAELGYAGWPRPLALVAGLSLLQLFVTFVVIGKRGMLMPR